MKQDILCQFLIGKVKQYVYYVGNETLRVFECQFLIGKVKPVEFEMVSSEDDGVNSS